MQVKEEYNKLIAKKVISALENRNMAGYYAATKAEAVEIALGLMEKGSTVSWGGSESLKEAGLIDAVYANGGYNILDRAKAATPEENKKIQHDALSADYYLMSSNALTLDGELLNIDGNGNRAAALIFGPENIIMLVGTNKIVKNLDDAMNRVRNYTAPLNTIRLGCDTPCAKTGFCHDCTSSATICCQIVTTRFSRVKGRIKVIIVGEELGY